VSTLIVRLVGPSSERHLRLAEFVVDYHETAIRPGEILTAIEIPFMPRHSRAIFLKFTPRAHDDYGTVTVAVRLTADRFGRDVEDVRIAMGAVDSTWLRATEAEAALLGQPLGDAAFREAAALAREQTDPISDLRGSAEYKRDMAEVFVGRALIQAHAAMVDSQTAD
jgi:carbon-monoxide dehydrogenase medium subunit